ncbi:MAG: aminotransferase class V-fold PLP-dependent enzyme, partial [Holophagaceae bacterium]
QPTLRNKFPILSHSTYLVSHSMGAAPLDSRERILEYWNSWNDLGITAWDRWVPFVDDCRATLGKIIGAPGRAIAFHQNVSTLVHSVLGTFDWSSSRNEVLISELTFPTLKYCLEVLKGTGIHILRVPSRDGISHDSSDFTSLINARTAMINHNQGIYRSSAIIDIPPIVQVAHQHGARVLVDTYQTAGMYPLSVTDWGVDFAVGGSHKWLCGGPGASYLYIRPDLLGTLKPQLYGWMAQREVFGFAPDVQPADDARAFMTGTFGIPSLYAAKVGWETILEVGVTPIRQHVLHISHQIIRLAQERGLKINSPLKDEARGGQVCVGIDNAHKIELLLGKEKILLDSRPYCGLRISGHFYTEEREVLACFNALDSIIKR